MTAVAISESGTKSIESVSIACTLTGAASGDEYFWRHSRAGRFGPVTGAIR